MAPCNMLATMPDTVRAGSYDNLSLLTPATSLRLYQHFISHPLRQSLHALIWHADALLVGALACRGGQA